MVKKILAGVTAFLMLCCIVPLSAFADNHTHTFGDNKRGIDMSSLPDDYYCPVTFYETPCSELCGYSKYEWTFGARSDSFVDVSGLSALQVYAHWHAWFEKAYGAGANLKQFTSGGGSADGSSGVGRRPSGYADNTGTPAIGSDGRLCLIADCNGIFGGLYNKISYFGGSQTGFSAYPPFRAKNGIWHSGVTDLVLQPSDFSSSSNSIDYASEVNFYFKAPATGVYRIYRSDVSSSSYSRYYTGSNYSTLKTGSPSYLLIENRTSNISVGLNQDYTELFASKGDDVWPIVLLSGSGPYFKTFGSTLRVYYYPTDVQFNNVNNITINNNNWNGNIYVDNSTNLTYIYPQYTTINENNETITNISNNPIIYNSTTNEYYTYDSVTNNYYYITYVTETPTPTPEPDPIPTPDPGTDPTPTPTPGTDPTPTPTPGGNTGDTSSILDVLVQIRDNMIQGFADIKATVVQGWADFTTNFNTTLGDLSASFKATIGDLSANFSAAIENLNINIQNFFNKKFPDEPEPTPTPSPSPVPTPSPTSSPSIDPILPDTQNYIIPKMNSNTFTDEHGTWIASGSSKYSDVFDYFRAFDRSAEIWETNVSPSNLQIEIPDPESYYVDGYIMRVSKFTNRYPKDWTLQGSDDGKTWNDLDTQAGQDLSDQTEHKYSLSLHKAYKYYRLNMSNYASAFVSLSHFNLLGYDAEDVVTPTPTPAPTETPTPTQSPGSKPSGDTNNFWNFVFPGSDDGTDNGHKGILWALISLLIAVVTFVLGLGSAYTYVFPFLPSGLVTTIHICVLVLLLFAIIKFVRSFL